MEILIAYLLAGILIAKVVQNGSVYFNPLVFMFVVVGWLPLMGWFILRKVMA